MDSLYRFFGLIKEEKPKPKYKMLNSDDIYEGIRPERKVKKPEFNLDSLGDLDDILDTEDPTCPACLGSKIEPVACCDMEALRRIMEG